ncbi:tetratricopeptide repeat-containing sensor histidine kinase [Cyclobacterium lianum]|uniref:tetratricopeptide repeat-containing sensor histidine kinase n=1 Tax=Cyclobacterium lianum TaxID=388280 RepID=UPI001FEA7E18|nr:tetratricopeptide repeat protein [Cyclobacterium lianum]
MFLDFRKFFSASVLLILVLISGFSLAQRAEIESLLSRVRDFEDKENFSPDKPYIDALNRLGELYYNLDPDSTFLLGMKSLQASEKAGYQDGIVDAYRNIGAFHNIRGQYAQAMNYFEEGLNLAGENQYWLGMANIYNSMGLNHYDRGNYQEAVTLYLKALEIKEKHLSEYEQSKTLSNLGLVFSDMGDFDQALNFHNRALDIRKRANNKLGMASSLANIGLIYKKKGKLDEALASYTTTLEIGETIENGQLIAVSHFNLGDILLQQEDLEGALYHFEAALELDSNVDDIAAISSDLLGIGEALVRQENLSEAKRSVQRSLDLALESDIKTNLEKGHDLLHQIYEKQGNNRAALYHFKQHTSYRDSLRNLESERQIREMAAKYEFDKKEAALRQEQREKELENEKLMERRLRIGFSIILVILLIAFFIALKSVRYQTKARNLLTRQKDKLESLNKKILHQKKETEQVARQLIEVNKTKDKLFSIVGHDLKSPINSLKGLMQYAVDEKLSQEEFLLVSAQLRNEVEHVHFTLINLLHWAKNQMKGIVTEAEKVSVNKILQENINLYKPVSEIKQIQVLDQLDPETNCLADKEQCNLIVRNLLNNALKFTNRGGEIIVKSQKSGDTHWEISIQDNGIGMDRQTLSKLFQPVFKGKQRYGTSGEKGTGLGLQLSRDFILKNGGDIKVSSEPGKGSTFTFTLPAAG